MSDHGSLNPLRIGANSPSERTALSTKPRQGLNPLRIGANSPSKRRVFNGQYGLSVSIPFASGLTLLNPFHKGVVYMFFVSIPFASGLTLLPRLQEARSLQAHTGGKTLTSGKFMQIRLLATQRGTAASNNIIRFVLRSEEHT